MCKRLHLDDFDTKQELVHRGYSSVPGFGKFAVATFEERKKGISVGELQGFSGDSSRYVTQETR